MKFEIHKNAGFWGIGIWLNPHNRIFTVCVLKWQFRLV